MKTKTCQIELDETERIYVMFAIGMCVKWLVRSKGESAPSIVATMEGILTKLRDGGKQTHG